jgi:hypothetical protein
LLPETLYQNILLRRARRLRAQTGDSKFRSQTEIDHTGGLSVQVIAKQIADDFVLPFVDPVVLSINLHTMLLYSLLYLWFEFFPFGEWSRFSTSCWHVKQSAYDWTPVFGGIYGFSEIQQGRTKNYFPVHCCGLMHV